MSDGVDHVAPPSVVRETNAWFVLGGWSPDEVYSTQATQALPATSGSARIVSLSKATWGSSLVPTTTGRPHCRPSDEEATATSVSKFPRSASSPEAPGEEAPTTSIPMVAR